MASLLIIQIVVSLLFLILGWAIVFKKAYWLISNFSGRTKEDKELLIENGYPQKAGWLLIWTAVGMFILLPLTFTPFQHAMEVQFGFMLIFLLGGFVYLSKFEVPHKRKFSYFISILIAISSISFTIFIYSLGYQDFELKTHESQFEVTGTYGGSWDYKDILKVELMEEMPEVTMRVNGFGMATVSKGVFTVEDYGKSLLFIHKGQSPYLYIETSDKKIFINSKDPKETARWHESMQESLGDSK